MVNFKRISVAHAAPNVSWFTSNHYFFWKNNKKQSTTVLHNTKVDLVVYEGMYSIY